METRIVSPVRGELQARRSRLELRQRPDRSGAARDELENPAEIAEAHGGVDA
jgi:hypothetical protein